MPTLQIPTNLRTITTDRFDYNVKVYYVDSTGDVDISSDYLGDSTERRDLLYGIGAFNLTLNNENGKYNDKIIRGTTIKIYSEYTTGTPNTFAFIGKVDNVLHNLSDDGMFTITLFGRDFPELEGRTINKSFSDVIGNTSIQSIVDTYFSTRFTYNNVVVTTATIFGRYNDLKAIAGLMDILKQLGQHGYIDRNGDIHTFENEINNQEGVLFGINMAGFSGMGKDHLSVANKVRVIGSSKDNLLLIHTRNDVPDQDQTWIQTEIVQEGSEETVSAVEGKAISDLDFKKVVLDIGNLLSAVGLQTLQPGQSIFIDCQRADINGYYTVVVIRDERGAGMWLTSVELSRMIPRPATFIRKLENDSVKTNIDNPNDMDDTIFYYSFDDSTDIATQSQTTISNGKVTITSGTQANFTSTTKSSQQQPSKFEFRVKGIDLAGSYLKFSSDGGTTSNDSDKFYYLEQYKNTAINITTTGSRIRIEVFLNKDSSLYPIPQLEGMSVSVKY